LYTSVQQKKLKMQRADMDIHMDLVGTATDFRKWP